MENEVRIDSLGHGAVITMERGARPHDSKREFCRGKKIADPKNCFFCPGNENLTPPELERVAGENGWKMRVFENKFPAFSKQSERSYGIHEVIVETPRHDADFSSLPAGDFEQYLSLLCRRVRKAYSDGLIEWVLPFKNEGLLAGASLEHTHSQLVAASFVPQYVREKSALSSGRCRYCEFSKKEGHMIYEGKGWKALCPNASRFNYEIWILPARHVASLLDLKKSELESLASILRKTLSILDRRVGRPPYNVVFNTGPKGMPFHLHIEILPRLARFAGFEFGSGMNMNSVPPEWAARLFRF